MIFEYNIKNFNADFVKSMAEKKLKTCFIFYETV